MEIIVEDGTGVADANSYITLQNLKDYAESRGETLPDEDPDISALLFQAMDYLQYNYTFKGVKTYPDLDLEWPRDKLPSKLNVSSTKIPRVIQIAQMKLACIAYTEDLSPVGGASTTREKVDVIEVQYSDQGSTGDFYYPLVDKMLQTLTTGSGNGLIQTVRVERA